ncbi:MAG: CvpA family protein [Oscillospiraceae bacterium]
MEDNTTNNAKTGKKGFGPKSKLGKIAFNIIVTLVVGAIYFYVTLPALNLQSGDFYAFVGLLCVVYFICALITSGMNLGGGNIKDYFKFVKSQCLPVGILFAALLLVAVVGNVVSLPVLRAGAYRDLLEVKTGDFATDIEEVSFNEIPMLDGDSAMSLGDRKMGELPDLVSQFEVASAYTQINYQGAPVRVTYLDYGDFFKWFANRGKGLPAYITVNMVTQKADVVRLEEGMKYSPSELFNRNLMRHLRFKFPTYLFSTPTFEIDESGHPYWVCPKMVKTIGLFGGTDIDGAVLMDAVTGEATYYDSADVPTWVDRVYLADLIVQQYNYHGSFINGFINSIFGQKGVTVTTEGYSYLAMNDDVYMYTGVTSISSDQSNVGFLLSNQRTKETTYYAAPGAVEQSARNSAQGMVQDLKYTATWPLLLNISGEPTYFMSLKDANQLVKQYAMVNVGQYQIVATGSTLAECEAGYLKLLASKGITTEAVLPQTEITGTVEEIRTAVMEGNSFYFIRLKDQDVFYSISATAYPLVVVLNPGDRVVIEHAPAVEGEVQNILSGYSILKK